MGLILIQVRKVDGAACKREMFTDIFVLLSTNGPRRVSDSVYDVRAWQVQRDGLNGELMNLYGKYQAINFIQLVEAAFGVAARRLKPLLGFLVLVASLFMQVSAYAVLLSEDSTYGAGSITRDTDTGLEWLDPVLSMGAGLGCCLSYNDVLAQTESGGLFEGFRFATASELETLFFVSGGIQSGSAGVNSAVAALMSLVGDTFNQSFGPDFWFMATSAYYDTGMPGQLGLASLELQSFWGQLDGGNAFLGLSSDSPGVNGGPFGSWLVRESLAVAAVDEPGMLLVFVFALLSLGLRRLCVD